MVQWFGDNLKGIALMTILLTGLWGLGVVINNTLVWQWLTDFFTILRRFASGIDFFWDTDTMFTLIGVALGIQVAYWGFKAYLWIIHYFRAKA